MSCTCGSISTPLDIAALAVWFAQVQPDDTILEPSAGNGLLVAHVGAHASLHLNEIDPQRRERLIAAFPAATVTGHDGAGLCEQFGRNFNLPALHDRRPITPVPTGYGLFPRDTALPRRFVAERVNFERWEIMLRGGHFAAAEEPGLIIAALRIFLALLQQTRHVPLR